MTETEIAWAAGFYEGEGSVSVVQRKRGGRPYVNMSVSSTDLDVLERWLAVVGFGKIYPVRYRHHEGLQRVKEQHRWSSGRAEDILALLACMRPYMGDRRGERADAVAASMETR